MKNGNNIDMIDSYFHCGGPRFGSAAQAGAEMSASKIECANLVLPPSMPESERNAITDILNPTLPVASKSPF